jgi:Family of unknown function (DUF5677)
VSDESRRPRSRSHAAVNAGAALVDLVDRRLPLVVEGASWQDSWPTVGPALLARCAGTVEAIGALEPLGRAADVCVLLRSLADHVIAFAWLAVDPDERIPAWRGEDARMRLVIDEEARSRGRVVLPHGEREQHARVRRRPDLRIQRLAVEADAHWSPLLPPMRGDQRIRSFEETYSSVFRFTSSYTHATVIGLGRVATLEPGRTTVHLEPSDETVDALLPMAPSLFALGLRVGSLSLGWPEHDELEEVLVAYEHAIRLAPRPSVE